MQWKRFYHPFTESLAVEKYGSYPMELFSDIPFGPFIVVSKAGNDITRKGMKRVSTKERLRREVQEIEKICRQVEEYVYNWIEGGENDTIDYFYETRMWNIDVRVYYFDSTDDNFLSGDVVVIGSNEIIGNVWRYLARLKDRRLGGDYDSI